ncbi:MAG: phospho-N-acetylmuramoyl-pentapeptide-transferase [Oscillospiraceae bacterium]|nr:phospho-N-acetylmuramoyl-pentapeptide-transferase [Oscillospiraceae bacterium]
MLYIFAAPALSFVVALVFGRWLIPFLKSVKMGQKILDIGPRWHKSKEGTPYMGGLLFIAGTLAAVLVFGGFAKREQSGPADFADMYTLGMALCYAAIGFADDYAKRLKKRNEGLSAVGKLALQFPVAIAYTAVMHFTGTITTKLWIPFANINADLGIFYYICVVLGIVFIVNSVNLHDGIDGMCGSVSSVVMVMYMVLFRIAKNDAGLILSGGCLGGIIGYLWYNWHPAKIFMGDTGSLFLGAMVVGLAVWLNVPVLLTLFGIVYIIEIFSVIIQVSYFKLTKGKRFFKMAPIHHHFELCGWSEHKLVAVTASITAVMAGVSVLCAVSR